MKQEQRKVGLESSKKVRSETDKVEKMKTSDRMGGKGLKQTASCANSAIGDAFELAPGLA